MKRCMHGITMRQETEYAGQKYDNGSDYSGESEKLKSVGRRMNVKWLEEDGDTKLRKRSESIIINIILISIHDFVYKSKYIYINNTDERL